ncbi:ABC transporter domain-containing protein [Psidium guajava]|nr:ABC transporter domain-containing protein [Psidium guajava]
MPFLPIFPRLQHMFSESLSIKKDDGVSIYSSARQ